MTLTGIRVWLAATTSTSSIGTGFLIFKALLSNMHIRRKTVVIRPHDKSWMNGKVRGAIRKRNRLLKIHSRRSIMRISTIRSCLILPFALTNGGQIIIWAKDSGHNSTTG